MASYEFQLNGRAATVEAEPEMPILWVLRDLLGLTGTKYGCGVGSCGACTVHLDGRAVQGCQMPVSAVEGKRVTTIEGLSEAGDHSLQRAWVAEDVPQCGFCQVGQIMTAAALLSENAEPEDADIDRAMRGMICRCGTYQRIRAAIHRASQEVRDGG